MPGTSKTVEISGLLELNLMMEEFPRAAETIIQTASRTYRDKVYHSAKSTVPVRTGFLQSSIGISSAKGEEQVFADAHYANYVDQGTFRMPGRPFMSRPAADNQDALISEINQRIGQYFASKVIKKGK